MLVAAVCMCLSLPPCGDSGLGVCEVVRRMQHGKSVFAFVLFSAHLPPLPRCCRMKSDDEYLTVAFIGTFDTAGAVFLCMAL